MLTISEYRKKENRIKRFLFDALGDGLHYLDDFWSGGLPPAVQIDDFGVNPEFGQMFEVELLLPDRNYFVPLEQIAEHVAKARGIAAPFSSAKRSHVLSDCLPSTPEEYAALKASIQRHGRCYQTVIKNKNGKIIDGSDLLRACKELGLPRPKTIVISVSDQVAEELALELNTCRKYTSLKTKRKLAALLLRDRAGDSDNSIGIACGLTDKTVTTLRRRMEEASEIPKLETRKGRDGKAHPAHPSIECRNQSQEKRACSALTELGKHAPPKNLKLSKAEWAVVRHRKDNSPSFELTDKDIRIDHCDFRDLDVPDKSIDMFFTDPPYSLSDLSLYEALGEFASRKLKPGGILLTYVGTRELIPAGHLLEQHLKYYSLIIVRNHGGVFVPVVGRKLMHGFKTMLYFSNGSLPKDTPVLYDFMEGTGREKHLHPWQQPVGEASKYIGDLSKPGDLICDPFLGSGTTAVACKKLGRRFVGCDIDLGCVNLARKRVHEAIASPSMNNPPAVGAAPQGKA